MTLPSVDKLKTIVSDLHIFVVVAIFCGETLILNNNHALKNPLYASFDRFNNLESSDVIVIVCDITRIAYTMYKMHHSLYDHEWSSGLNARLLL